MRHLITFCVLLAAAAIAVQAQSDKRVTDIRAKVAKIDSSSAKLTKTKKDVPGISTEGAEATFYRAGKELKKIAVKIYGETFNGTSEFYFDDGKMIFEYDRVNRYDTQIGLSKPVKVVRVEQMRGYFEDGKMFRLLFGKKVIKAATDEFTEYEKESAEMFKGVFEAEAEK